MSREGHRAVQSDIKSTKPFIIELLKKTHYRAKHDRNHIKRLESALIYDINLNIKKWRYILC